jgi:hypothetical protein
MRRFDGQSRTPTFAAGTPKPLNYRVLHAAKSREIDHYRSIIDSATAALILGREKP